MPRKRMIDPSFWRDEKISKCTYMERLLFQGLWTFAEDNGVGRANPLLIKADVFPYETLREADIKKSLEKLASLGLIQLYEVDNQKYYYVINFAKHQTINRPSPSTLPLPDEALTEDSLSTHGGLSAKEKLREDKIKEKEIDKEKESVRHKYGEYKNVLLSDEEIKKLKAEFPKDYLERIERLSEYMASKGASYKNHLATIRNWAKRDEERIMSSQSQKSYRKEFAERRETLEDIRSKIPDPLEEIMAEMEG